VESGTVFGEGKFPEGGLFLDKAEVITADGQGTSHGELAEAKCKLKEGQSGATAIGFRTVGSWVIAKDGARARGKTGACSSANNPSKGARVVSGATITYEEELG